MEDKIIYQDEPTPQHVIEVIDKMLTKNSFMFSHGRRRKFCWKCNSLLSPIEGICFTCDPKPTEEKMTDESTEWKQVTDMIKESDPVNKPAHYVSAAGLEAIEVIEAFELNFNMGNAIKYILRAGKKDDKAQDLSKAMWYLKRELENHIK